jgi:porphobilinogen deaminase
MKIGTSSLRRKMYAKHVLLAENIHDLNGNIDSRLNKLESGEYDCIVLSEAGIRRLYNQTIHIPEYKEELNEPIKNLNYKRLKSLPAVGQGRLLVQYKPDNRFAKILKDCFEINDDFTREIHSMRYFLNKINADCNSAIGFYAHDGGHSGRTSIFEGQVFGLSSFTEFRGWSEGNIDSAMEMAFEDFIKKGGKELLDEHN